MHGRGKEIKIARESAFAGIHRKGESSLKKRTKQVILILILVGISIVLFVLGKGHNFLIDNKSITVDGKSFKAFEYLNVYIGADELLDIWEGDRVMSVGAGPWHKIKAEAVDENGKVLSTVEKSFSVGLDDYYVINIPLLFEDQPGWLTERK